VPDLEAIRQERYVLMSRCGLSYQDWRAMARWQRMDYLARWQVERQQMADRAKRGGWKEIVGLAVSRMLGLG
jgi:hypothetical protein